MYHNSSRINIEDENTFSLDLYSEALARFAESEYFCNDSDESDWKNVGPRNLTTHQNGMVEAVFIDPTYPDEILIGAAVGGIFRSIDHGDHWISVTDDLTIPILGVSQIVQDPHDENHLFAVVGATSGKDDVQKGFLVSFNC